MVHFENYEEYMRLRREMGIGEEEPHSELVMEENTIYEIDTSCEKCLKRFWRRKAAERQE